MRSNIGFLLAAVSMVAPLLASDELSRGVFNFSSINYAVVENSQSGVAVIEVVRSGGSMGVVSVQYATADGTATAGQDYQGVHGTLTFAAGQTSRTFAVPIFDDALAEGNETVMLTLTNAAGGATFPNDGRSVSAPLVIVDNELSRGALSFGFTRYQVSEKDGLARITVNRTGGSVGMVSVEYYTVDATAFAGLDYQGASGTLLFSSGQTQNTFTVRVTRDYLVEADETVQLLLTNAAGGATLGGGSHTSATLVILDSDRPRLACPVLRGSNALELTFEVEPSFRYTVEYTTSIAANTWASLTNIVGGEAPFNAVVNHEPGGACFYRVRRDPAN